MTIHLIIAISSLLYSRSKNYKIKITFIFYNIYTIITYILKNFVHNFIKIGGASIWQKIIIQKRTTRKIMENKTRITKIIINNS